MNVDFHCPLITMLICLGLLASFHISELAAPSTRKHETRLSQLLLPR